MTTEKIPIKYINSTGNTNVQVIVFAPVSLPKDEPESDSVPATSEPEKDLEKHFLAWKVLVAQSQVEFNYPLRSDVIAYYYNEYQDKTISGPLQAADGSIWEIKQDDKNSVAILKEGM